MSKLIVLLFFFFIEINSQEEFPEPSATKDPRYVPLHNPTTVDFDYPEPGGGRYHKKESKEVTVYPQHWNESLTPDIKADIEAIVHHGIKSTRTTILGQLGKVISYNISDNEIFGVGDLIDERFTNDKSVFQNLDNHHFFFFFD